jgi:hypothetical protein
MSNAYTEENRVWRDALPAGLISRAQHRQHHIEQIGKALA